MIRIVLPALAALFLLALIVGCGEDTIVDPPPPDLPDPLYYTVEDGPEGQGSLVGWVSGPGGYDMVLSPRSSVAFLPGHPWHQWLELEQAGTELVWGLGPGEGGPFRRGAYRSFAPSRAYILSGWGDLALEEMVIPTDFEPPPALMPPSPLGLAELGMRWDALGRPDSTLVDMLVFPAADRAPALLRGTLRYDGREGESLRVESFRYVTDEDVVHFKLFVEYFPVPERIYWESGKTLVKYWGESPPNIASMAFDPEWPAPDGYTAGDVDIPLAGDLLPADRFRPEGDGPFPALLLVADDALADRNDAAAFGHLAHAFAREGWLVLRYDKPGTGASAADPDSLDLGLRRAAIAAAWQALRADPDIDPDHTLILGHGEGAALALEFAAGEPVVSGVLALSPLYYDPESIPPIPLAESAPGDWIDTEGGRLFVGKHKDLLEFDSEDYLNAAGWSGRPVLLTDAGNDPRLSSSELLMQVGKLEAAGAAISTESFLGVNRFLSAGPADDPPPAEFVDGLIHWLDQEYPGVRVP